LFVYRVSKTQRKNVLQKDRVGICKPIFSRFWAFLGEGIQKHDQNNIKNKSEPGPFLASDPPIHDGGHRFHFCRPLGKCLSQAQKNLACFEEKKPHSTWSSQFRTSRVSQPTPFLDTQMDQRESKRGEPSYTKGRRREKKMKATYIWQMATKWGRYLSSLKQIFFKVYFYGVFVRFSTRGVQKHHNKFWGTPCQKPLAEKVEKKTTFFLSSFPTDFFSRGFRRFSA
jgi:hypothetical protein